MTLLKNLFCVLLLVTALCSCTSKKKILYFQDVEQLENSQIPSYKTVIRKNDLLSIMVSSRNMESVQFLNRSQASNSGDGASSGKEGGGGQTQGYLVSADGTIDFPTLGSINVEGKTKEEVESLLETKIREFTTDAEVSIRLLNFKITVLGEVGNPGVITVVDERLTIPQAIGYAGDLKFTGKRNNILLIREVNGVQKSYRIDLTSAGFMNSDRYYLQQNDVLYVTPNNAAFSGAGIGTSTQFFLGLATLAISIFVLLTR